MLTTTAQKLVGKRITEIREIEREGVSHKTLQLLFDDNTSLQVAFDGAPLGGSWDVHVKAQLFNSVDGVEVFRS